MNRLVYSNDLDDPTADLKILARLTFPTRPGRIGDGSPPALTSVRFQRK